MNLGYKAAALMVLIVVVALLKFSARKRNYGIRRSGRKRPPQGETTRSPPPEKPTDPTPDDP